MDSIQERLSSMKGREDVDQAMYDLINILMDRDWALKNAWNDLNARLDKIAEGHGETRERLLELEGGLERWQEIVRGQDMKLKDSWTGLEGQSNRLDTLAEKVLGAHDRLDKQFTEQQRLLAYASNDQGNIEYLARRMTNAENLVKVLAGNLEEEHQEMISRTDELYEKVETPTIDWSKVESIKVAPVPEWMTATSDDNPNAPPTREEMKQVLDVLHEISGTLSLILMQMRYPRGQ